MRVKQPQVFASGICQECGLRADATRPACQIMRDELLARDFQQIVYWRYHRLAVDAYCLQHPLRYCESAKSLAAHLCGLCIRFEMDNSEDILRDVQRWLSTNPTLSRPEVPDLRGDRTIGNVYGLDDPVAYGRAVEEWGQSVWTAYRGLHSIARDWISLSRSKQIRER
jgi:hypothetical protein